MSGHGCGPHTWDAARLPTAPQTLADPGHPPAVDTQAKRGPVLLTADTSELCDAVPALTTGRSHGSGKSDKSKPSVQSRPLNSEWSVGCLTGAALGQVPSTADQDPKAQKAGQQGQGHQGQGIRNLALLTEMGGGPRARGSGGSCLPAAQGSTHLVDVDGLQGQLPEALPAVSVALRGGGHASAPRLAPGAMLEVHGDGLGRGTCRTKGEAVRVQDTPRQTGQPPPPHVSSRRQRAHGGPGHTNPE